MEEIKETAEVIATEATPVASEVVKEEDKIEANDQEETNENKDEESDVTCMNKLENRELKSILQLCKEAKMEIIDHKRKSLQPQEAERKFKLQRRNSEGSNDSVASGDNKQLKNRTLKKSDLQQSTPGGATTPSHKKPNKKPFDVTMHKTGKDAYCWRCHKPEVNISCETCPRSYHLKCVKMSIPNPSRWPCPECVSILTAESTKTRSPALKAMTLEHLCGLLKFAVKRMMQCAGSEPFIHPVSEKEFPEYRSYIIQPMDLTLLEKNIKNNLYGSTQAFEADTKWLLHNSIIFNSYQSKLTTVAKQIIKVCKQEMSEIETCSSCYLNANTKKNTWFVEVCPKPHLLVWAKLKGFPYWPAKAMRTTELGMVDVRFFGAHDRAWVPYTECYLYTNKDPNFYRQKRNDINECMKEVEVHVENIKKVFGEFIYAPYRTPYQMRQELAQLKMMIPSYEPTAQQSGSPGCKGDQDEALSPLSFKGMSTPSTDRSEGKVGMEGYGTEDDSIVALNEEKREDLRREDDKDGVAEKEEGDLSFKGKIDVLKRPKSACDAEKRIHVDGSEEVPLKKIRRNSSATVNKSSPISEKTGKLAGDVEITLADDATASETTFSSSEASESSGSEGRKIPVIQIDNSELTISPQNKSKISDQLIKKLSPNEKAEAAKRQMPKTQTDVLLEKYKSDQKDQRESVDHERVTVEGDKEDVKSDTAQDLMGSEGFDDALGGNKINDVLIRNIIHSSLNDLTEKKTDDKVDDGNAEKKRDDGLEETTVEKMRESMKVQKEKVEDKKSEVGKIPDKKVKESDAKEVEKKKVNDVEKKSSNLQKAGYKRKSVDVGKPEEEGQQKKIARTSENKKSTENPDLASILKDQLQKQAPKTAKTPKPPLKIVPFVSVEIKSEPCSDEENNEAESIKDKEDGRALLSALQLSEKLPEIQVKSGNQPVKTRIATRSTPKGTNKTQSAQATPPKRNEIQVKPLTKLQPQPPPLTVTPKARKTFPGSQAIKQMAELAKKNSTPPTLQVENVAATSTQVSASNMMLMAPTQPVVLNSRLGQHGMNFVATTTAGPFLALSGIVVPQVNVGVQNVGAKDKVCDVSQGIALVNGQQTNKAPTSTATLTAADSSTQNILSDVPSLIPLLSTTASTPTITLPSGKTVSVSMNTSSASIQENRRPEANDLSALKAVVPETVTKALTDITCRPPPKLKPKPPSAISNQLEEATPSTTGTISNVINSASHRLADFFRGVLLETITDLGDNHGSPEAAVASLKAEIETLKHTHEVELMEIKKNIYSILNDIQKSITEDRERLVEETRAQCMADAVKRIEEVKGRQWCASCLKEAQFYCCWNTSYCDYVCQQNHWPKHMATCAQGVAGKVPAKMPKTQAATAVKATPTAGKTLVAKTTKVIVNKPGATTTKVTTSTSKPATLSHITLVESTPGNYEFVGNGPISIGGKIPTQLGRVQKVGGVTIAPNQKTYGQSNSGNNSKGKKDAPTVIGDSD